MAGYPETHQEAVSPEADLENLRRKVDAGGDIVITQLFYATPISSAFRDRCRQLGIAAPIVPGHFAGDQPGPDPADHLDVRGPFAGRNSPPPWPERKTTSRVNSTSAWPLPPGRCRSWSMPASPGIHFYVLNKSPATAAVLRAAELPA